MSDLIVLYSQNVNLTAYLTDAINPGVKLTEPRAPIIRNAARKILKLEQVSPHFPRFAFTNAAVVFKLLLTQVQFEKDP